MRFERKYNMKYNSYMKHLDPRKPHTFFFETLGNQARWDIVHLLQESPHRVTDIAEKLGLEQSLVSHHLRRLKTCGFVTVEKRGTERVYSLNEEDIGGLLRLIDKHVDRFCKKVCSQQ